MPNLLDQTLKIIEHNGHGGNEVKWVGASGWAWCAWEEFVHLADKEYEHPKQVAEDLILIGDGWWLEWMCRGAVGYWQFHEEPVQPEVHEIPTFVMWPTNDSTWRSMQVMNGKAE